uniref:Uncharacterized protein n=1 Tax=Entomoneis paludosa TaxID=265537 RepID=A0A6U3BRN0_9STRA|mmetsp:Transcript_32807/g.68406  ORF Transcript_32807/g.68406 Transcript_32807/m.68406 type:complete len:213 (+) Transcript_32807:134-772(+)|eukprot:CAMPEP_0172439126 /NCGR_PEP_ID=MMETSP1065-20121228/209_1 /TAXON_ID=265537 /ORGANISM="Amphiprora paludosa, Strain CCMP125" /LENGTH=212 /DNA_ID=CAMNT_0013187761 /DNA_START=66 /DNA_END=704 /DNA_ORIENTATION=+
MRITVLSLLLAASTVNAFTSSTQAPATRDGLTRAYAYVPDGFTPESYKKFKEAEAKKLQKQNLGKLGPKGFKSRSFQSFQEALERGEADHLMPVFNAKERVKKGELRTEDIPYMQRGGSWDNSDVKNAKNKKRWLSSDKEYANGGYKKEQSVSVLGFGSGLDWTGKGARTGPSETVKGAAPKFAKNYKAPNVNTMKNGSQDQPKKKGFFGLF